MITPKMLGMLLAAFVAGSFVASSELRAYAANTVFSTDIVDGQVKTSDLAGGAVTNAKLGANSVNSAKIADGTIDNADLAASAVTSAKIAAGGVANSDIAGNAVTTSKIADETIRYADVAEAFIAVDSKIDCNCGGLGWDPAGNSRTETIFDNRITRDSAVVISTPQVVDNLVCWTQDVSEGNALAVCNNVIPEGIGITFAIFNPR